MRHTVGNLLLFATGGILFRSCYLFTERLIDASWFDGFAAGWRAADESDRKASDHDD